MGAERTTVTLIKIEKESNKPRESGISRQLYKMQILYNRGKRNETYTVRLAQKMFFRLLGGLFDAFTRF